MDSLFSGLGCCPWTSLRPVAKSRNIIPLKKILWGVRGEMPKDLASLFLVLISLRVYETQTLLGLGCFWYILSESSGMDQMVFWVLLQTSHTLIHGQNTREPTSFPFWGKYSCRSVSSSSRYCLSYVNFAYIRESWISVVLEGEKKSSCIRFKCFPDLLVVIDIIHFNELEVFEELSVKTCGAAL